MRLPHQGSSPYSSSQTKKREVGQDTGRENNSVNADTTEMQPPRKRNPRGGTCLSVSRGATRIRSFGLNSRALLINLFASCALTTKGRVQANDLHKCWHKMGQQASKLTKKNTEQCKYSMAKSFSLAVS